MSKFIPLLVLLLGGSAAFAQVGGNGAVYQNGATGAGRAHQNELDKRKISKDDQSPADGTFVEASVLINRRADEYVAVFGINQEGATLAEANQKMDEKVAKFSASLEQLGIRPADFDVDFVNQNRIYGYDIQADLAQEKVVGFEIKKNVSVHYQAKSRLEQLTKAASDLGIFDLIKVDYVVRNLAAMREQLMREATKVIKSKLADRATLLGAKVITPGQVLAERYASYYPTDMYTTYVAQESQNVMGYRPNMVIQQARKASTSFFDPLNADTFDQVINPIVVEPVVQFTLYLKLRYVADRSVSTHSK